MKVNPDKFQAIAIGKNTQSKNISFNLNGNIIKTDDEVKLLGVTIDYELKFNSHITNICRKASRQLNVLKRMGKYSEANTKKMEKIQERALKFIYNENHSTYEELLAKSKLPSLKIRRIRSIAIETFKIINKETPQYLHDLVTLKNNKYNFRYSNTAHIPTVKTTRYGLNSFRYYASKTWNELPDHFRKETSFNQFKSLINSWNGSSCHCSFCA